MSYCQPDDVRRLCGFSLDIDDTELSYYISKANTDLIRDLSIRKRNATLLAGPRDTEWYTENKPIADINGDSAVTSSDVQVYAWADIGDESTKTPLAVSSINWITGRIVLDSSPGSKYITADYSYYPNEVDWGIMIDAEAYLAGFKLAIKKWVHIPEWLKMGTVSARQAIKPYIHLYNEYRRCMVKLKTRKWKKGQAYPMFEADRKRIEDMTEGVAEELVFPGYGDV